MESTLRQSVTQRSLIVEQTKGEFSQMQRVGTSNRLFWYTRRSVERWRTVYRSINQKFVSLPASPVIESSERAIESVRLAE